MCVGNYCTCSKNSESKQAEVFISSLYDMYTNGIEKWQLLLHLFIQYLTSAIFIITTENSQYFHILYIYSQTDMPASDHSVLLDIHNFKFQINQPPCQDQTVLLAVVHSAPHNVEKRLQIRKTWGSILQGALLFVIGEVDSPLMQVQHSRHPQTCGTVSVGSSS